MGRFIGKPWQDENGKSYCFMIAWGNVTRDAKVYTRKKSKAEVGIAYARKQFLNVEAWQDSPCFNLIASMERGDQLLVFGTYMSEDYTTRDGEHKTISYLKCEIAVPMSVLGYVLQLCGSSSIKMLLEADANAPADPMEGADDYDPFAQEDDDGYEPNI